MFTCRSALAGVLLSTAAVAFSPSAQAITIVNSGDLTVTQEHVAPPEPMIFLDDNGAAGSTLVTGNIGSQSGVPTVSFLTGSTVFSTNGFAAINAPVGGVFHDLTFTIQAGYVFSDLVFDVLQSPDFTVTSATGSSVITDTANGDLEFLAISGSNLTQLAFHSDVGFTSIRQFEISGVSAIPEASTWAMMMLGFAGVGLLAYRRRGSGSRLRLV
jgi:hypothetical protein